MRVTRKALEDLGYEVVDFKISNEEFLEIRELLFVILSHFLMVPSIKEMYDQYEEPLTAYKFIYHYITGNCLTKTLMRTFMTQR